MKNYYHLIDIKKWRLAIFIRNHWSKKYTDGFLVVFDHRRPYYGAHTYRIGMFNVCLCFTYEEAEDHKKAT